MMKFFYFELLRHRRSKFQLLLVGALCVIFACSIFIHWSQQNILEESQHYWKEKNDELWLGQPDRHPHRVSHYGYVAIRPLSALSFIDSGVEPYAGNYLFLEAHKQNSSSIQSSPISPLTLRLGFPSVSNLFLLIWPLLIIFLGYGSFSHDWDTGRLMWAASMGGRLKDLFFSKFAVFMLYTIILLLVTFFISASLLWINKGFNSGLLLDLFLMMLTFGLYSAIWISIILLISYYSQSGLQSLGRLLIVWVSLLIVLPKLSIELTKWKYQTPKRAVFDSVIDKEVHSIGDAHNPDDPYFSKFKQQTLDHHKVKKVEDLPINWNGVVMAEGERITSEIFQKHYQNLSKNFDSQDEFYSRFGFITPYISFRKLILTFSCTDRKTAEEFESISENFRYDLISKLNSLHSHEINHNDDRGQKLSSAFWKEIPLLAYSIQRKAVELATLLPILLWLIFIVLVMYFFNKKKIV
ncbi:MAG: DUF3526 domain-containing protein [Lentisphaeraceae bacterium]|nr:DUF3526 domain-containing protein [Lentisphaeraceae bacterium]